MKRRFVILDTEVVLDGPEERVAPIAHAYGRFLSPGEPADGALWIVDRGDRIEVDGHGRPRPADGEPTLHLYQHFLDATLGRVASHAVLHAGAVVGPDGGALIVAGPSGHGKSSLTQALVAGGGRKFLSDDYAPLDLRSRTVAPYPRTVGLLPGGGARIPAAFAEAARAPGVPRLFGKVLIDVGRVLGEGHVAGRAAPLRHVVLLCPEDLQEIPPPATRVELTCLADAVDALLPRLKGVPGLTVEATVPRGDVASIALRLDPAAAPSAALTGIAAEETVLFCQKYWEPPPDFDAEPTLTPIRRRLAAEFLGRELLNRAPGSRLLARYRGDLTALFLDLAAALRDADCHRLRVGRFEASVELLRALQEPIP